ncbi:hypothetical protein BpHYR1_009821 [Brachionus plicatilis]|uniref:Uncharacterized protein n=1 Tax=Brachionus plicatilis TaxID=10195 RepID=A0A3M7RX21_BRAPC|nr:hypothetical protein BpHYR1_009821 [Brachionus plicatilis]
MHMFLHLDYRFIKFKWIDIQYLLKKINTLLFNSDTLNADISNIVTSVGYRPTGCNQSQCLKISKKSKKFQIETL